MATVNSVLTERIEALADRRRWSVVAMSLGAHGALVAAVLIAPWLAAEAPAYPEIVRVRIVPVQALGVRDPEPAAAEPQREPPKKAPPVVEAPPAESKTPPPEKKRGMAPPKSSNKATTKPTPSAPAAAAPPVQRQGSPTGLSLGSSAFGASVAGLDNPDFTYSYYVDQMLAMIRDQWLRPPIGGEVEVTIHFRIRQDGSVYEVGIARSSGFNQFDLAGLRAVEKAAPLPPLPRSYRHDSLGVNLIMR